MSIDKRYWPGWPWFLGCVLVGALLVWCGCWFFCWRPGPTQVFVIRHADRAGSADDLSALGTARADELVHVLGEAEIEAIYRSNTVRNEKTAAPLAQDLGVTPIVYGAGGTQQLVSEILSVHAGNRVLVVGHSNTVPEIVERLSGQTVGSIGSNVYDDLFLVHRPRCRWRPRTVIHMKYGASTP